MYVIICFVLLLIATGFIAYKYNTVNKELQQLKNKPQELPELPELSKSELKTLHTIVSLEEANEFLEKAIEVKEEQYQNKVKRLSSQMEKLKEEKELVQQNLAERVAENKEQELMIRQLEARIEGLRNKDIYKMCFESSDAKIEELKEKNKILEKNLEAKRKEIRRLSSVLKYDKRKK